MKKTFALKPLALSLVVAAASAASVVPATAQAEVSYNAAVSNFYLWRGQDISAGAPAVSGGIDYAHDSGLYAGVWTTSEEGGTETDLYAGYGFSVEDFSANIAYWSYWYPSDGVKSSFDRDEGSLLSEVELTVGYADLSLSAYIDTEEKENRYYSLDYSIGDFGLHAGKYVFEADDSDYTDYGVSYAATDNLSFTLSKAQGDGIADGNEKPLLNVSYGFTF